MSSDEQFGWNNLNPLQLFVSPPENQTRNQNENRNSPGKQTTQGESSKRNEPDIFNNLNPLNLFVPSPPENIKIIKWGILGYKYFEIHVSFLSS